LARLGGDEFSVILSEVSDPSVITNIVKRLIKAFDQPLIINHLSLKVGISIGIVIFPDGGMNADDLCKNADQAMYKAKSFGKHNFHFYRFESEDSYQRNLLIESTMKRGIEDGEFYVLYQPIYQLSTQQIIGAEALCRWHHKSLGEVMPDEFIPIAESSGLIIHLGKWVLKEVIKTISKLPKSSQSSLTFSVNVSMVQFYDKEFVSFVAEVLKDENISGEMIEMEITETVISKDSFHYQGIIQQLNSMGIKLSIDDFGTGYSSLRRLHQLSISTLKIDRSFIMDIPQNEKSIKMIVSILDLAKSMNLKLIAEGIETDDQLKFLVEHKCAFGQGYFFSKPIKFSDFHSLLNKK
jgi:EAL domain-containing protein (putative c-di-GMP-specific phosphodiesterase class I)